MRVTVNEVGLVGAAIAVVSLAVGDWLAAASLIVLWLGVKLLSTDDGIYVLIITFAFHWFEVTCGLFYVGLSGRTLNAMEQSDWRRMVLIGLGCLIALALGLGIGRRLLRVPDPAVTRPGFAFTWGLLITVYILAVVVEGGMSRLVEDYPTLRQIIVTVDTARLGILFLVLRRLLHPTPRYLFVVGIVVLEVALGLTGFFAGFREPIVLAALAMLEVFDRRNTIHWLTLGGASIFLAALGLMWMGIRADYRRDQVEVDTFASSSRSDKIGRVQSLTSTWLNTTEEGGAVQNTADKLFDRMWTIYYPALAVARVPLVLPHTNGQLMLASLTHIVTPRIFFPDKAELPSDSEMVRKYSGVNVAGRETNTSIAFGYAAESYIDFGLPLMFIPIFLYGLTMGLVYALFSKLIWHRDLLVSFATVSFWLSFYLFERSWSTMLGVSLGFIIYLGAPTVLLDRLLLVQFFAKRQRQDRDPIATLPLGEHR